MAGVVGFEVRRCTGTGMLPVFGKWGNGWGIRTDSSGFPEDVEHPDDDHQSGG